MAAVAMAAVKKPEEMKTGIAKRENQQNKAESGGKQRAHARQKRHHRQAHAARLSRHNCAGEDGNALSEKIWHHIAHENKTA